MKNVDITEVKVPVKHNGKTEYEQLDPEGQSDGSYWSIPHPLTDPDHEHFFVMRPEEREAVCECGFGGRVYPHNATLKDGHIYNLKGEKVI